jgi:hypothetical protein
VVVLSVSAPCPLSIGEKFVTVGPEKVATRLDRRLPSMLRGKFAPRGTLPDSGYKKATLISDVKPSRSRGLDREVMLTAISSRSLPTARPA